MKPVQLRKPENNGHIHVVLGDFDTPHMRGARSAIMSNINGWRTLTDNMYRPRVLQQGEPTGIWARVGGGKYSYTAKGIDTDTTYTRIQGGYDAKTGSGWTVWSYPTFVATMTTYSTALVKKKPWLWCVRREKDLWQKRIHPH